MPAQYYPMLLTFVVAGLLGLFFLAVARWAGPFRPDKKKAMPSECGTISDGTKQQRYSIKFYLVALLFIVFDIEVVFMYPWAVQYKKLGLFGFVEMLVFIGVLTAGLAYVWKKGALKWE